MRSPERPAVAREQEKSERRPPTVAAVAIGLAGVAMLSVLGGLALSAVSSCCGSPDPADPKPALLGVGIAVMLAAAAVGLWSGHVPRWGLLLLAAPLPLALVAASPSSADLAGLLLLVVPAWLWLWWYLRRPTAEGWVGRRRSR
jgi:hypothetical protein